MNDEARGRIVERVRAATRARPRQSLPEPAPAVLAADLDAFAQRFGDLVTISNARCGSLSIVPCVAAAASTVREVLLTTEHVAVGRTPLALELAQAAGVTEAGDDVATESIGAVILEGHALTGELGSVLVDLADLPRPSAAFLVEVQVLVARPCALVHSLAGTLSRAANLRSPHGLLVSGPSRTADVEKTLVCPAHGPRETHLVIVGEAPRGHGRQHSEGPA